MDIEALFRHKAFSQLESGQLQLLRQFARDIQGKGATEIAGLYMQLNKKLTQIKPISTAQRSAIVEAIRSFLPEADRQKINKYLNMLVR